MARKQNLTKRVNPAWILISFIWIAIIGLVYFIDPSTTGAVPLFFSLVISGLYLLFSLVLSNSRRGFIISLGITSFLILRYFGLGNFLNLILIAGVLIALEMYFLKSN